MGNQARYNAVWREGSSGEKHLFGVRYADYRSTYDELWPQGWRLHLLNNPVENGQVRYDAIWRPGSDAEAQVYSWEYDGFRGRDTTLRQKGHRLHMVNTYAIA